MLLLLVEWVLPLQPLQTRKLSISALERQPMLNGESGEVGIQNQICHGTPYLGVPHQKPQHGDRSAMESTPTEVRAIPEPVPMRLGC